jgi:hypothetical protein
MEARRTGINSKAVNFRPWHRWIEETKGILEVRQDKTDAPQLGASAAAGGPTSEMDQARIGTWYILGMVNNGTEQGITAREVEWAGRNPTFPQLFMQHSMRIAQDTYVFVAAGAYLKES